MTWCFLGRWSLCSVVSRWSLVVSEQQRTANDATCFPLDAQSSARVAITGHLLPYSVPLEGITTIFSTVVFSGKSRALTTIRATVSADIILRLGAFGHSACQIAVSVAPGIRAITRMPFGLNSSRKVLVNPRAPCFDAL